MPGSLSSVGISSGISGGGGGGGPRFSSDLGRTSEATSGDRPKNPSILGRIGQIVAGVPGGIMQIGSDIVRLPLLGQSIADGDFDKRFPALHGLKEGFETTGAHLNPLNARQTLQDYGADPVGMLLNDVGNVATVATGGLAAAGKAGLTSTSLRAGSTGATIAGRLEKVAAAGNKLADIPLAPYRYAGTRLLESAGSRAARSVEAGSTSSLARGLIRLSPNAKALQGSAYTGKALEEQALSRAGLEPDSPDAGVLRQDIRQQTAARMADLPFARRGTELIDDANPEATPTFEMPEGYVSLTEASRGALRGAGDSVGVPASLAGEVGRLYTPGNSLPGAKAFGEAMSPFNRVHRMFRMDLSPGWAFGQVPGNAAMVAAQSPTPLRDVGRYVRTLRSGTVSENPRIARTGTSVAQSEVLENRVQGPGIVGKIDRGLSQAEAVAAKTRLSKVADRSDNAARSAFYEGRIAEGNSPQVAEEMTLRALGEFDKMGPMESAYLRPGIPFYRWSREVLKMTAHLAEDHPVRAAVMANLARVQQDAEGELSPGEREVDGGFLVPYGQSGESFKGTLFGVAKKLSPPLKLAAIAGTGKSLSTGKDLHIDGRGFGEDNYPGIHNLRPGLRSIAQGYPVVRAVKPNERYQTRGEALLSNIAGVDVSHAPTQERLDQEKADRARRAEAAAADRKIRRLTEQAKAGS